MSVASCRLSFQISNHPTKSEIRYLDRLTKKQMYTNTADLFPLLCLFLAA